MSQLALYNLYLPLNGNDGQPIPQHKLQWVWETLLRFAGGYTIVPPAKGHWSNASNVEYRDTMMPVQVVALASSETEAFFAQFIRDLAVLLGQEEIFLFSMPVSIV